MAAGWGGTSLTTAFCVGGAFGAKKLEMDACFLCEDEGGILVTMFLDSTSGSVGV
jgi:hypothetical protein